MNNSLIKNFITYGFGSILFTLANLLLIPVFLEKLEINDYGILSISLVTVNFILILFSVSISNGILRAFNENYSLVVKKEMASTILIFFIISGLFFIFLTYFLKDFISLLIFNTKTNGSLIITIVILGFLRIFDSLNLGILRANNKPLHYVTLNVLKVLVLGFVNIYIIFFTNFSITSIIEGYIISGLISSLIGFLFTRSDFKFSFQLNYLKYFLQYGIPLSIASFISLFINYGNRYFLLYFTNEVDVAYIDISQKIASLVGIILTTGFISAFTPYYLNLYSRVSFAEFSKKINEITLTFSVFFCFIGLGIVLFQDLGLSLLSKPEYLMVSNYVPYLIFSNFFHVLFMILTLGTNILKKTKIEMYITVVLLIVSVAFNVILIKSIGLYGAVFTQVFINLLSIIIIRFYNKIYFPINISYWIILKLVLFTIILIVLNNLLPELLNLNNIIYKRYIIPLVLLGIFVTVYFKDFLSAKSKLKQLLKKKINLAV